MVSVVLLTTFAQSPLADQLTAAGYKVTEALWADEILHLMESERIDVVVITHDVIDLEIREVEKRVTTLRLQPQATANDVVWELVNFFNNPQTIQ